MTNSNSLVQETRLLLLLMVSLSFLLHIRMNYCEKRFVNDDKSLPHFVANAEAFSLTSDRVSCRNKNRACAIEIDWK